MRRRGAVLAAIAVTASVATAGAVAPARAQEAWSLPDLVPDAAENLWLDQGTSGGQRVLRLRFDGFVHNRGPGPLELRGYDPVAGGGQIAMSRVVQRVYAGSTPEGAFEDLPSRARMVYESDNDHTHFHLKHAVEYRLVSTTDPGATTPEGKNSVGFCLVDDQPVEDLAPGLYTVDASGYCGRNRPTSDVVMGLSAGWRDIYGSSLDFQWVDISDTTPGEYRLSEIVDPDAVIAEADETNNVSPSADVPVTVPGMLALSGHASTLPMLATRVRLQAARFASTLPGAPNQGPAQFAITAPPAHGHLSVPTGRWFDDPQVVYRPDPGFLGEDSFRFAARDAATPAFPVHPREAEVRVHVGLPSLFGL